MSTRYVRHISGQGERWLVAGESPERWIVDYEGDEFVDALNLPKSEYVLVMLPETDDEFNATQETDHHGSL